MGFYLSHLGLLFVLIGALLSATGYTGYSFVKEGETIEEIFGIRNKQYGVNKLKLSVELNRFETLHRNREGIPYRSTITLYEKGGKIKTETIEGYESIAYKDIRISQAASAREANHLVHLAVRPKTANGKSRIYAIKEYEYFKVPETDHIIRLVGVSFPSRFKEGKSIKGEMVRLEVFGKKQERIYTPQIYSNAEQFEPLWDHNHDLWEKEYGFSLLKIEEIKPVSYAMLKISIEPGSSSIWGGIYMAITGFSIMFLCSPRRSETATEKIRGTLSYSLKI